jgi:sortase A
MARFGGRRTRLLAAVAALVVAGSGVGAWAMVRDDPAPEAPADAAAARDENPVPDVTSGTVPPTTAPALPVPAPVPADERAPTPEVVLGDLSLPSLGVTEPMGEGVTLTAVDRGPGHWPGSAMPGQLGNVVVAGHRTTNSRPFHDLDLLQPGDPLVFTMPDGAVFTYRHTGTEVVEANALHIIDQTPAHTATLFACHPKGSDRQRIVARFELAR